MNETIGMPDLVLWAIPLFAVMIGVELALAVRHKRAVYEMRDTLACLAMGIGNVAINVPWKFVALGIMAWLYQFRVFDIPVDAWWAWLVLLVAEDFCYYWFHRLHHVTRIGWSAHVNHHSSTRFNLAVALRQSWTTPFTGLVFWLPLALVGFHPLMILTQQSISLVYQFWIHTQTIDRLGPLEWFLNTPSHHRVHHGRNARYVDRNYGGILIVWDRLFGTFEPESEPVDYGIVKPLNTFNPVKIAFHEWRAMLADVRRAPDTRVAMGRLFRHPAWQPPDRRA